MKEQPAKLHGAMPVGSGDWLDRTVNLRLDIAKEEVRHDSLGFVNGVKYTMSDGSVIRGIWPR